MNVLYLFKLILFTGYVGETETKQLTVAKNNVPLPQFDSIYFQNQSEFGIKIVLAFLLYMDSQMGEVSLKSEMVTVEL